MKTTRLEWNACNTKTGMADGQCISLVPCTPQVGNLGKEVAGSQGEGGFSVHSKEIATLPTGEDAAETGPSTSKDNKWLAARFYQLKTGHRLTGRVPQV